MRLSVALCTCNGQKHLPRQLRSLLDQQRRPDELVVHDDASTDDTVGMLQSFAAVAPFEVRLQLNEVRVGVHSNFQSAMNAADGDIIACCDQDDVWYPEKLKRLEAAIVEEGADLAFGDADLVDENLRPLGRRHWDTIGFGMSQRQAARAGRLWTTLVRFNAVTGAGMAFRSHWREFLLPIPAGWTHDGWIGLLLSLVGKCRALGEPLWAYRRHEGQQIGPGPATFGQKIAKARNMDRAYFELLAGNFAAVVERIGVRAIDLAAARALRDKIVHCRNRAAMRTAGAIRTPLILEEVVSGRYRRCSLGWKSLAQDMILAREE